MHFPWEHQRSFVVFCDLEIASPLAFVRFLRTSPTAGLGLFTASLGPNRPGLVPDVFKHVHCLGLGLYCCIILPASVVCGLDPWNGELNWARCGSQEESARPSGPAG